MDSFNVIISPKALSQLNNYIDYLQYTLLNEQAAYNLWQDALEARDQLSKVASSLKLCAHPQLKKYGYHIIHFIRHRYLISIESWMLLQNVTAPIPLNLGLGCTWTLQQIECAADIMFKQPVDLEPLYDEIVRTAIFTVKPYNIAAFLRQRITYSCKKEVGTNYNQRILGTRSKHHMGDEKAILEPRLLLSIFPGDGDYNTSM